MVVAHLRGKNIERQRQMHFRINATIRDREVLMNTHRNTHIPQEVTHRKEFLAACRMSVSVSTSM